MDFKSNVPLYQQIMQKKRYNSRCIKSEPVPSLREMSQQLNVNQNTVMRISATANRRHFGIPKVWAFVVS